jgi:hypothetical protein
MSRFLPHLSYGTRVCLLLLPYSLGLAVLVLIPAAVSFGLAFFHYDALSPPRWASTPNFTLAYTDSLFDLSIHNSLALIVLPVPMRVLGAFLLARQLQCGGRFLHPFRSAVYLPRVIPGATLAETGLAGGRHEQYTCGWANASCPAADHQSAACGRVGPGGRIGRANSPALAADARWSDSLQHKCFGAPRGAAIRGFLGGQNRRGASLLAYRLVLLSLCQRMPRLTAVSMP